jgi:PAS domain-containing protein
VAIIASWATAHGHGPVWLMKAATPEDRTILLQVFLGMVAAVALPVGSLLDERREAERRAQEGQSIYSTLIDNAEDMIILSTLDGARWFVSPAVEKITGWTADCPSSE